MDIKNIKNEFPIFTQKINGKPLVYCKFDCSMTEFALTKALEDHLERPPKEVSEEEL